MTPNISLHITIENDCRRCCPRVFSCFCCKGDKDQYIANKPDKLIRVNTTNKAERRRTIDILFHQTIPDQIGCDNWLMIREDFEHLARFKINDLYKFAIPIDDDMLDRIMDSVKTALKMWENSLDSAETASESN